MVKRAHHALNALLSTGTDEQHRILVANQSIDRLSSEEKWRIRDELTLGQKRSLLFATINYLPTHLEFGETVASLFGYSLARYIYLHMDTIIPHVLQLPPLDDTTTTTIPPNIDHTELMDIIASTVLISTTQLYQDYGYFAIIHCLLLDPTTITTVQREAFLNNVFSAAMPHVQATQTTIAKRLLMGHVTRVTAMLCVELWRPRDRFVLKSLEQIKSWTGYESLSLASYLCTYMLGIINHINDVLTNGSKLAHRVLASLIILLDIPDMEASGFFPQLLGIAHTAMERINPQYAGETVDACCLLWDRLLDLATEEETTRRLGEVIRTMVYCLPLCGPDKTKMVYALTQAIKTQALEQDFDWSLVPDLPPYPELDELRQWVHEEQQESTPSEPRDTLAQMIVHMSMDETIPSFDSLRKLHQLLTDHQTMLYTDQVVWPLLGELYEVLLRIIKQYSYRHDISGLAATCLGALGAVDPGLLVAPEERLELMLKIKQGDEQPTMRYTSDMIVLHNYTDRSENQTFAIHLIIHYFLPTMYASSSYTTKATAGDVIRTCSQYAIQELLKAAGMHNDQRHNVHDNTQRLWQSLDPSIRDVVKPLSYSKFEANLHIIAPIPPFYNKLIDSFDTWARQLCLFLLDKVKATAASDPTRQMVLLFQSCIPSIKAGHVVVAQHLIPFLVLRLLLSSPQPEADRQVILDEIIGVLKYGANRDMKQSTLQLIVAITGHCRQWIHQKLRYQKKRSRLSSRSTPHSFEDPSVANIKQFLAQIPHDLMAQAAFRTGNYPQALMHYELAIKEQELARTKTRRQGGSGSTASIEDYLDDICQTYMHLEGPEAMAEVLAKTNREWSLPQEVLQFESRGQWGHAKSAYEALLRTDLSVAPRYFHCLQQLGDYAGIIDYGRRMLDTMAKEGELGKQVTRYLAEAAWKSSNWPLLQDCVCAPMDDSFEASVASVLAHMQQKNPMAVFLTLQKATTSVIQSISKNNPDSYQQSYDAVLRLQLLHELDSIMMLSCDAGKHTMDAWKIKFRMLKPSYQTQRQLLDLHLAAQYDIWKPVTGSQEITDTERELRLVLAKTARKAKDMDMALKATHQANIDQHPTALVELAKWYNEGSDWKTAMQYLRHSNLKTDVKASFLSTRILATQLLARKLPSHDRSSVSKITAEIRRVETNYADIKKRCPDWEKVHLVTGNWEEQRCDPLDMDYRFFKRSARAILCYCDALRVGCRYYYSTMPRLLSLWLQIADAMRDLKDGKIQADAKLTDAIKIAYASTNECILKASDQIPTYLFASTLPRLVSRLAIQDKQVARILAKIILNVLIAYPRTTIWALQFAVHSQDSQLKNISNEILRQAQLLSPDPLMKKIITQMHQFTNYLELLSKEKCPSSTMVKLGSGVLLKHTGLLSMTDLDLCIPHQRSLIPRIPEYTNTSTTHQPFPSDLATIAKVLPSVQVMSSLQRPKRISFLGSDGKTYDFLCKQNDDLRKDARSMEFSHMINHFLTKNDTARGQLYIRTYAVIPLSNKWGLIQWIDNLNPLKAIVRERWETDGMDPQHYERLRHSMRDMEMQTPEQKVQTLVNEVYPASPVVFYRWFLDHFPEPFAWYESRSRYIRTLAVMSIVGYVLGLGDRHADNIMFDSTNGDTVHVDLNLLFDFGQELAVPEIVPFRLTRNLVDAMGTPKAAGLFKRSCVTTLNMLREYRQQLLSVFETFLHDPITDQRKRDRNLTREQVARKEIDTMSNKIQSRSSTNAQVEYLIREASSDRNLAQMYSGWTAFM